MSKTQLLIDADYLLFQSCAAVEQDSCFDGVNHILHCNTQEAMDVFMGYIESYEKEHDGEAICIFSGSANFRKQVWPLYKSNRKATRKPLGYYDIIEKLKDIRTVKSHELLEGDDYIGILATRPSSVDRIIVSGDKDMKTLPNVRVVWKDHARELDYKTDARSAEDYWWFQTLVGDTTDGYKGCPGIGEVSAKKIIEQAGDPWENVLEAYRRGCAKKPEALEAAQVATAEELALINARLARILRSSDWDGKNPILWSP